MKKIFEFNEEKNILLKELRGINFEDVLIEIKKGNVLDDIAHPSKKYPKQRIFVIKIKDYIYVVPYVTNNRGIIFLKTIFPSRKLHKHYQNK